MTTYVYRKGKLVQKARSRTMEAGFFVVSDNLGGMLAHPVTGQHTDSKSRFRQMTRDTGCVEVGTERQAPQVLRKSGEPAHVTIKRILNS